MPDDAPTPSELDGLDPGELLARGLNTIQPTGGSRGWIPPEPEELAAILPQYRIESLLGHGGMGAVYRGVQIALDRPVAIKLLPLEISADRDFADRFVREARTLAKLSHPNIVAVHDFGTTTAGHLYFVMEFVEGTNLHQMIHGPGLNPAQALTIIIGVCEALQYAHGKGVVHRDIKPANVMVSTESQVKVADFGLARLNNPAEDWGHTMTGAVMGTPDYMAPEQTRGMAVDHRADIYSLGVMLYEMLCGEVPRGVFEPPSRKVQVDVRIDEVVLKAMQSEPERRYQNTVEMKTDVDAIRANPQPPKPAPKPKSKAPVAAVIAACLAVLSAALVFVWGKKEPQRASDAAGVAATSSSPAVPAASSPRVGGEGAAQTTGGGDAAATPTPATATKDAPFVNTLGMKFVPVPITGGPTGGQRVLFSVWETQVQDFREFAKDTNNTKWIEDFARKSATDPVTVRWQEATYFCTWLTDRERQAGKLGANERYRLPSDHEWSCAVGIGDREDPAQTPAEKSKKLTDVFPWGSAWPPTAGAGNYAGEEVRAYAGSDNAPAHLQGIQGFIESYKDSFTHLSPAGSFPPNGLGLHDLGGNLSELCEEWADGAKRFRVTRGGSWMSSSRVELGSSHRSSAAPTASSRTIGLRVVLAPAAASAAGPSASAAPAEEKWVDARQDANFKGNAMLRPTGDGWIAQAQGRTLFAAGPRRDGAVRIRSVFSNTKDGRNLAIIVRWNDPPQNYYQSSVLIGGDEVGLNRHSEGKPLNALNDKEAVVKRKLPAPLQPGEEYELEVRAVGDRFTVKLQGTVLLESRDDSLGSGTFGVGLGAQGVQIPITSIEYLDFGGSAPAAQTPQPGGEVRTFGGHRYQMIPGAWKWDVAKAKAEAMGGHLVTISSKEEDEFVRLAFADQVPETKNLYLGAFRERADAPWQWVTGEPFKYSALPQNRPGGAPPGDDFPTALVLWREPRSSTVAWHEHTQRTGDRRIGFLVEWDDDGAALSGATRSVASQTSSAAAPGSMGAGGAAPSNTTKAAPMVNSAANANSAPKPQNEIEKWLAQVDAPQQAAFQKDAVKPYEDGAAELRKRYLAALDAGMTKASAAGQLAEALVWRDERQTFEKGGKSAVPDTGALPAIRALRADFQQKLARFEQDRAAKAKTLHAAYDAILAQNETALTQRQRLDDALVLKKRRDDLARAWLPPDTASPSATGAAAIATPATPAPQPNQNSFTLAEIKRPFVNTLGMKFVPVPITGGPSGQYKVLFSVWETRMQDFEVFVNETKCAWSKPAFEQGPTHPAGNVNWKDAQTFCAWLTERERRVGLIRATERYRLPSDHEWSRAIGSSTREDPKRKTPIEKSGKVQEFPWGKDWPPPRGAGNYSGEECSDPVIKGYHDNFPTTAPVGSFAANRFGLFDLGGNVWELCADLENPIVPAQRTMRGASYAIGQKGPIWWSARERFGETSRNPTVGFRVVLTAEP